MKTIFRGHLLGVAGDLELGNFKVVKRLLVFSRLNAAQLF